MSQGLPRPELPSAAPGSPGFRGSRAAQKRQPGHQGGAMRLARRSLCCAGPASRSWGFSFSDFAPGARCSYNRFALTWDFAVYHQPWFLIAHGNLDPRTSVESMSFWRNDSEFAIWPLAMFYWVWPHDVVLLWLQDIGIVVAEAVAFGWLCELAARRGRGAAGGGPWLAGAGLALLVLSPWIWWSASFDFHLESIALPFAVLLARDLYRDRRRMWIWIAPILSAGAPEAVYVIGIGLGARPGRAPLPRPGSLPGRDRPRLLRADRRLSTPTTAPRWPAITATWPLPRPPVTPAAGSRAGPGSARAQMVKGSQAPAADAPDAVGQAPGRVGEPAARQGCLASGPARYCPGSW